MLDAVFALLLPHFVQVYSLVLGFLETTLCLCFFAGNLPRRRHFPLRLAGVFAAGAVLFAGLGIAESMSGTLGMRIFCNLMVTLSGLCSIPVLYRGDIDNITLVFCAGEAAHQITGRLYPLIQNFLGIDDKLTLSLFHGSDAAVETWEWILFFGFHFAMYWLLSRLFRPKTQLHRDLETTRSITVLFFVILITANVLTVIVRVYEWESLHLSMFIKAFAIDLNIVLLLVCNSVCTQNERSRQLSIIQQLWKQDQAQFQSVKASMDVINMKCHDLKHILHRVEGKLNEEEVAQLSQAITFYDSNIKTGCEVLDVVLCEKTLLCQQNGIQLQCLADGRELGFLSPVQIYTIFGNILDNAAEACMKLTNPAKKVISLTCQNTGACLEIAASNFFLPNENSAGDALRTSKPDAARHGFGIRSIEFIVAQYGGTVQTQIQEDMFFLTVRFPR